MKDMFAIRQDNMMRIIMDKHQGNKAAFSRITGIHPNHVNLLANDNPKYHRNMGEELARRIEEAMGLTPGWMDSAHGELAKTFIIKGIPMDESISRALVTCKDYTQLVVTNRWEMRVASRITAVDNLTLATVCTPEMEPIIPNGGAVIIDTGVKGVSTDGIYVLSKGDTAFIRSIRRNMDGTHNIVAANPAYRSDKPEQLKGMKVIARVISNIGDNFV